MLASRAEGDLAPVNRIAFEVLINLSAILFAITATPIIEVDADVDNMSCFAHSVVRMQLAIGFCDIRLKLSEERVIQLVPAIAYRAFSAGANLGLRDVDCLHLA